MFLTMIMGYRDDMGNSMTFGAFHLQKREKEDSDRL